MIFLHVWYINTFGTPFSVRKRNFFCPQNRNIHFGPWARMSGIPTENRVEMTMRKQEHSPTRALHSSFLHEAFRPSVELNGMPSPELKNVRFPHEIFDPVFHGTKAFGSEAQIRLFYLEAKITLFRLCFSIIYFIIFIFFYTLKSIARKVFWPSFSG